MTVSPAAVALPNGARVAVLVSALLESWGEGKAPTYFPRTTPLRAGLVDLPGQTWSEYGGEEGLWRLLRMLGNGGIPATVFCNALSAERYPDLVREIVRCDQRVAAHGYAQSEYLLEMSDEQQQATIRRSLDILERTCGKRPSGWVSSVYSWNAATANILVQEGLAWHADALNTSLPRLQKTASGPIVAIPWSDFVDNRVRGNPSEYFDTYVRTFDYLLGNEHLSLLHLSFHSHFGGRPVMTANIARVLEHISSQPGVWMARHDELAAWFRELGVDRITPAQQFGACKNT